MMDVQVVRHWKSPEERDEFWRDLLRRFDRRVQAYARTARLMDDETSDVVWDLWEEAVRHESALLQSPDPWEILLPLLRQLCARRVRIRRHEHSDARAVDHYALSDSIGGSCSEALAAWMEQALSELTPRQRDSRGRFIVTPTVDVGRLAIYDSTGAFLRLVGARGRGPGEYQLAEVVLVAPGDSLYIFDGLALGFTVLTPEYRYARSVHLGVRAEQALRLGDGQVVIQSRIATPERFGLPVHTLAPDGRVLRSFGSTDLTIPPGALLAQYRLIAAASASSVWAARLDRYEVQEWSDSGELRRTLLRDPTWFTRADGEEPGPPDEVRPPSALRGLSPAPGGRLWVLATVARADWKPDPKLAGRDPRRGRPAPAAASLGRYLDTVVELLDPARGQLVAAQRMPGVGLGVAGPGLVYARRERPDGGGETIEISRLRLVMPAVARPQ